MAEINRPVAIQVSGVKKMYRLGQIGGGSLQADLQSWWARVRGKEDPNIIIGEEQRSNGESFMALNGIDLTIYQGEAVGIIGSNGAGKSTLLKLLSKVTAPTEGEIDIYGRIASMLEVGTGFNGELTGRENIYMNGAILGMTKAEIDAKMEEIIEFSEVREFIDTPVKRYSSGMFVKLAFSVAAHLDSEIMIMDEVLAVGDMAFQTKCLDKMRDAANLQGRTVLYVSHNMNTIRKLCKRCIVLDKGKVVFTGDVDKAISVYLGDSLKEVNNKTFLIDNHESWCDTKIIVKEVILDNDFSKLKSGDYLSFILKIKALASLDNIRMRLVILSKDGQIVGMAMSDNYLQMKENDDLIFRFKFSTQYLAAGLYTTRLSFFEINKFGTHNYVSVINDFFTFRLNDNPSIHFEMNWEANSWGHIAFPPFSIEV